MESSTSIVNSESSASNINATLYSTTCKVYEAEVFRKLTKGIQVSACMISDVPPMVDEASVVRHAESITEDDSKNSSGCMSCKAGPFESRAQQIAHYKHHWHTNNLRRRLLGRTPLTLLEFTSRTEDASSSSDSESDSDNIQGKSEREVSQLFIAATRHCRAYFSNSDGQVFSVYRCLLHHKKEWIRGDGQGTKWVEACKALDHDKGWAVIMCAGGHFAAAIFRGDSDTAIKHKALHSYVTRRGQGKAQANRDSKGNNAPRSAGASLRRYNQEQFAQHVKEILTGWKDELAACSLLMFRAVGPLNKACIFGTGSPLYRQDPRLRTLPFPTRRPTFKEVRRAHAVLASVEIYESVEVFQKAFATTNINVNSATGERNAGRKTQKISPCKTINRAKSREKNPRPNPIVITSSEDEGPCYVQSMAPPGWTKKLAEYDPSIKSNDKSIAENEIESDKEPILESKMEELNLKETLQEFDCSVKKKKKKSKNTDNKNKENPATGIKLEEKGKANKSGNNKKGVIKVPAVCQKLWSSLYSIEELKKIIELWDNNAITIQESLNVADPVDGNTALHKAAIAESPEIVHYLLELGGDPCCKNLQLQTPYCATNHQDTRIAFRLFQGLYPDKYQYSKTNIPGPLTPEMIEQEKEKKAALKKAKRQKDKEKLQEKVKVGKFLELNDKQKVLVTNESRCFVCGGAIKSAPFSYEQYKFCQIKCLQNHRNARPLKLSTQ